MPLLLFAHPTSAGPKTVVESRVQLVGGVPTFVLNGRPHPGMCYSSYDCSPENLSRRVRQFAEAGCDLFNFVVEIAGYGFSKPMWVEEDQWDFSDLDDRAHTILAAAPDAMLLPRIYLDAPAWWRERNPDELMLLDDGSTSFGQVLFALPRAGSYPSLASARWRRDMKKALAAVISHIEHSDYAGRVLGYQLSGQKTEEWYHWSMNTERLGDYSPHMQRAFRQWLRDRYRTDARLQSAWGRSDVTLASATIPTHAERYGDQRKTFRDPVGETQVIDFHRFWSDIMADTIAYFAQAVKQQTGGKKVVGAFYGYTFEFTNLAEDAGHLALSRLLRGPDVDFIMAPSSYFNRNLPGAPYFRAPVASLALHGKMLWNDFDQVSYKYYDKLKTHPELKQWEWQMGLTHTAEEFVWMNRREIGMALAQGVQVCHFDIHGGYYEDPVIMAGVRELAGIRRDALATRERSSNAQILLLADEDSEHYLTFRNAITTALLSAQIAVMPFVAPYDTALLSDLARLDASRYKLILVLNALKLDSSQRLLLQRKLARDGKTVVWYHAAGYFDDGSCSPANIRQITGINVVPDARPASEAAAQLLAHAGAGPQALKLLPGDQFRVEDPEAEALAVLSGDPRRVLVAQKQFHDWVSIYTAAAPLPASLLKRLAARAGVHIYSDSTADALFANRHHLTLCADATAGPRLIHLPRKTAVVDLSTGDTIVLAANQFTVNLRAREVRLFLLR